MKEKLRNIGPKSAAWLRQVGIHEPAQLRELGAVDAFLRIKRAGFRPSLSLLYALEGALCDCHWQEISAARRSELQLAAEAAAASLPSPRRPRVPAAPVTVTRYDADDGADDMDAADDADFGEDA